MTFPNVRLCLLLLPGLLAAGCGLDAPPPGPHPSLEEYGVYSAILEYSYIPGLPAAWVEAELPWLDSAKAARYWPLGRVTCVVVAESTLFPLARIDPLFPTGGPGSDSLGGLPEWLRMDELHQHFRQANALPAPLSVDSFSIPSDVALKLLGKAEAAALLTGPGEFGPEGAFASFYGRFPGSRGLVSFSRVGFSRDMTQAVVYTESGSTAAPEGGGFVFLRRLVDRWIIVYHMPAWVI